jgi:UrcA family protein
MNSISTTPALRGLILTGIFSALAVSLSTLAGAADSEPVRTSIVKYEDLNVSSPQGADTLYRRIRAEAAQVCSVDNAGDHQASLAQAACTHKAVRDAVIKVNEPALFTVYNAKNKTALPVMLAAGQAR